MAWPNEMLQNRSPRHGSNVLLSIIAAATIATAAIATEKISEAFFERFGFPIDNSAIFHDILHILLRRIRFHLALLQDARIEIIIKC